MQTPFSGHVRAFQPIVHPLRFRYKSVPFSYRVRRMIDLQWFTAACTMSEFLLATLEIKQLCGLPVSISSWQLCMSINSKWYAQVRREIRHGGTRSCCRYLRTNAVHATHLKTALNKEAKLGNYVLMSCCLASNEVIKDMVEICWSSLRWPHLASVHLLHKRQSRRFQGLHLRKRSLKGGAGFARTLLIWTTKKTTAQTHSTGWLTGIPYNGSTSHIPVKQGSNPLYTDTPNNLVFSLLSWIKQIPRLFCTCSSLL